MLAEFGKLLRAIASGRDPAKVPAPSEVIATLEVGQPPADWCFARDTYLYAGFATEAALAGNKSMIALCNPVSSRCLATVEEVTARVEGGLCHLRMAMASDVSAFDDDGAEWARDHRILWNATVPPSGRMPACKVKTDQAALAGSGTIMLYPEYTDNTTYSFRNRSKWVLPPGSAIVISPAADNVAAYASFAWRERRFDREENTGENSRYFQ